MLRNVSALKSQADKIQAQAKETYIAEYIVNVARGAFLKGRRKSHKLPRVKHKPKKRYMIGEAFRERQKNENNKYSAIKQENTR